MNLIKTIILAIIALFVLKIFLSSAFFLIKWGVIVGVIYYLYQAITNRGY